MAKVSGPLFSFDARGSLARALTFRQGRSGKECVRYSFPGSKNISLASQAQLDHRAIYGAAVEAWALLDAGSRAAYDVLAAPEQLSGWNYFLRESMLAPPGPPPFVPTDISGLQIWLDCQQITGLSTGDQIVTWPEYVNGWDFTSYTEAQRPLYHADAFGGFPCANFTSLNKASYAQNAGRSVLNNKPGVTAFVVGSSVSNSVSKYALFISSGSSNVNSRFVIYMDETSNVFWLLLRRLDAASQNVLTGGSYSSESRIIYSAVYDPVAQTAAGYRNALQVFSGSAIGTSGNFSPTNSQEVCIGNRPGIDRDWNKYIGEVLIFDRALTSGELLQMHEYLSVKWLIDLEA